VLTARTARSASWRAGDDAELTPGTGEAATTGAAESRIALETLAASAPLPASVSPRGPAEAVVTHRAISSTGMSAPSRSRIDARARFSSWRTAPLLAQSRAAISS